jgi:thiamine pyrophosphate-dependent acetolactate synthase large subunit-like protein
VNDRPPGAKPITIVVVTRDAGFFSTVLGACADIAAGAPLVHGDLSASVTAERHPLYLETVARARGYLETSGWKLAVTVVQAPTLATAAETLERLAPAVGPVGLIHLDGGDEPLDEQLEAFHARLAAAGVQAVRSPYAALVHWRTPPWAEGMHALHDRFLERVLSPEAPWLLATEHLTALVDFVERTFDKPRNHKMAVRDLDTTLGDEVVRFLSERAADRWTLFYYTGSSVSPLIDHLERISRQRGVIVLRGANEHALACGALAGHLLHDRPFLAVVGTAMMDEFRGVFANLRAAGARGFVICPESDADAHFTFQGTITGDEDMRAVLAARRIPSVYLDRVDAMAERLEDAFRLYEEGRGPVVLLVTQAVLDSRDPLPRRPSYPPHPPAAGVAAASSLGSQAEEALSRSMAILNRERTRVLWQASRLDAEEQGLVHAIAARAGLALVDTLGHPGPSHRDGRRVPGYLGTLGLYGFNDRTYAYLHDDNKLRPRADHCVYFLKSKVGQRATNFTPFRRSGLRMVQVTRRADHVAPDVEVALVTDARDFLQRTLERLDPDPAIVKWRQEAIRATTPSGDDLATRIPSVPMSPNYFFHQLGAVVERMIEEDGYDYTGVYDVGRSSVSATRAIARTRRGFSGWYGRALMGDAPAALPAVAILEAGNVVAFVGDGGRSIIADPVPHLIENALAHPSRVDKNLTIFYFSNGTFSGIRTYRERVASRWGGRQMGCVDLLSPDEERTCGPLRLVRRTLTTFDPVSMRESLLARRTLNVFTVVLGHNADDDGFGFVTTGWRRQPAHGGPPWPR